MVIAGTIGGGGNLEFTLIGDTVNVAARVEQLTKTTGDTILLTHQTVDALASRPPGLTDRGSHALKGKSAAVQVFGLDRAAGCSHRLGHWSFSVFRERCGGLSGRSLTISLTASPKG